MNKNPTISRAQYVDPANGMQVLLGVDEGWEIRGYHTVSVLLPDGRVIVGGGREANSDESYEKANMRYYYPPYFHEDRPVIDKAPSALQLDQPFELSLSGPRTTELVLMEDLGFAERGLGWKEVLSGTYDLDGELPINPDGGLKSFGHPIGASGLRMLFECWLQLRGQAPPERQIETNKTLGMTHNLGGAPGECVSFVSIVGAEEG